MGKTKRGKGTKIMVITGASARCRWPTCLYNPRHQAGYQVTRAHWTKITSTPWTACITQYEIAAACGRLSEAFLLPVVEQILVGFRLRSWAGCEAGRDRLL